MVFAIGTKLLVHPGAGDQVPTPFDPEAPPGPAPALANEDPPAPATPPASTPPPVPVPAPPQPAQATPPAPTPPPAGALAPPPAAWSPFVATAESARYRISHGLFGTLGELTLSLTPPSSAGGPSRAAGVGRGSLLGLGEQERRVEADVDPTTLTPRRWISTRALSDKRIVDTIDQAAPGQVALVRTRSDRPAEAHHFTRAAPVLDPLSFVLALRADPPRAPRTYEVLDGRALWHMTVQAARAVPGKAGAPATIELRAHAVPVFWDGDRDPERTARAFTLVMADDPLRTPLRLSLHIGAGEIRVELASVTRGGPGGATTALRRLSSAIPFVRR